MKKLTGETRLLLIMGLIVLAGGGFLALAPRDGSAPSPLKPGETPKPVATPKPLSRAQFDALLTGDGAHVKGDPKADLAVIEFADVECPSCRFAYDRFGRKFAASIPAQFSFHHFPLDIHPFAKPCANALEAAGEQGKFWELYHALFDEEKAEISDDFIQKKAKGVGLDMAKFAVDSASAKASARVDADLKLGASLGVDHTPTFFLLNRKDGTITSAVGPRSLMLALKGVPGIPTPEPTPAAR